MSNSTEAIVGFFAGGAAFWLPDAAIFVAMDTSDSQWRWILMTIACPLVAVTFHRWTWRRRSDKRGGPSAALFQLVGIWMVAPWFMVLASWMAPGRSNVLTLGELKFLLMTTFLPIFTVPASAMQGSLYGLVIISLILPALHLGNENDRWLIPSPLAFWRNRQPSN